MVDTAKQSGCRSYRQTSWNIFSHSVVASTISVDRMPAGVQVREPDAPPIPGGNDAPHRGRLPYLPVPAPTDKNAIEQVTRAARIRYDLTLTRAQAANVVSGRMLLFWRLDRDAGIEPPDRDLARRPVVRPTPYEWRRALGAQRANDNQAGMGMYVDLHYRVIVIGDGDLIQAEDDARLGAYTAPGARCWCPERVCPPRAEDEEEDEDEQEAELEAENARPNGVNNPGKVEVVGGEHPQDEQDDHQQEGDDQQDQEGAVGGGVAGPEGGENQPGLRLL